MATIAAMVAADLPTATLLPGAGSAAGPTVTPTARRFDYNDDGIRVSSVGPPAETDATEAAPPLPAPATPDDDGDEDEQEETEVTAVTSSAAGPPPLLLPPPPSFDDIANTEFCDGSDGGGGAVGDDNVDDGDNEGVEDGGGETAAAGVETVAAGEETVAAGEESAGGTTAAATDEGRNAVDDDGAAVAATIEEASDASRTRATSGDAGDSRDPSPLPTEEVAAASEASVGTEAETETGGATADVDAARALPSGEGSEVDRPETDTAAAVAASSPRGDSGAEGRGEPSGVNAGAAEAAAAAAEDPPLEEEGADSVAADTVAAIDGSEPREEASPPRLSPAPAPAPAPAATAGVTVSTIVTERVDAPVIIRETRHGAAHNHEEEEEDESWMNQPIGVHHGPPSYAAGAASSTSDAASSVTIEPVPLPVPLPPPPAGAAPVGVDGDGQEDGCTPSVVSPPPPPPAMLSSASSPAGGSNSTGGGGGAVTSSSSSSSLPSSPSSSAEAARSQQQSWNPTPRTYSHGRSVSDGGWTGGGGGGSTLGSSSSSFAAAAAAANHGRSVSDGGGWLDGIAEESGGSGSFGGFVPPSPPPHDSPSSLGRSSSGGSRLRSSLASISSLPVRGEGGVMEKLFGDVKPGAAIATLRRRSSSNTAVDVSSMAGSVLPRTLLPHEVQHNPTTGLWIATVHTNQKALDRGDVAAASRALEAYSFDSEAEAVSSALASAPPRMHPFADCPTCFVCERKFALLRRPCHCRNCGVCICSKCATTWPSRMIPGTYNVKGESNVKVCGPCNWLSGAFREALIAGNHDRAFALHATGNINLRSLFCNVKGEEFYPVHCAVMGGNTTTIRWLIEHHHCPIVTSVAGKKKWGGGGDNTADARLLLTSSKRSVLDIAVSRQNVDALRYLVVERGVSIGGIRDLPTALLTLEAVLRRLPPEDTPSAAAVATPIAFGGSPRSHASSEAFGTAGAAAAMAALDGAEERGRQESARPASSQSDVFASTDAGLLHISEEVPQVTRTDDSDERKPSDENECIICFEKEINCVATPCGHQICCLDCSTSLSECPVCKTESVFIRIFKP